MTIAWTNDLSTGIEVIDNQHKRIVDYINELEKAITLQNQLTVGHVLNELVEYTLSHFAFEESLQEEAGYKFSKPHKAMHDIFVKRIAAFQDRHKAGEDIAEQLHCMLGTWLVHHIKRDDMAYVADVNASINHTVGDKKTGGWLHNALGQFFK
jgi:hemerythrin